MNRLSEIIVGAIRTGSSSVEEIWGTFKTAIEESMNRNTPTKVCKKRKSLPLFNRDLRRMVRRKSRLYRHAKKTKQWGTFKNFQECKNAFTKAEIDHINRIVQKGLDERNTKPFWRYVKSRCQDFVGVSPRKRMGQLVNGRKEQAQILTEQFKTIFKIEEDDPLHPDTKKIARKPIPPLHVTVDGVRKLLLNIKINKPHEPDLNPNIMLKTWHSDVCYPLVLFRRWKASQWLVECKHSSGFQKRWCPPPWELQANILDLCLLQITVTHHL